jgi:hypothetical protein
LVIIDYLKWQCVGCHESCMCFPKCVGANFQTMALSRVGGMKHKSTPILIFRALCSWVLQFLGSELSQFNEIEINLCIIIWIPFTFIDLLQALNTCSSPRLGKKFKDVTTIHSLAAFLVSLTLLSSHILSNHCILYFIIHGVR